MKKFKDKLITIIAVSMFCLSFSSQSGAGSSIDDDSEVWNQADFQPEVFVAE